MNVFGRYFNWLHLQWPAGTVEKLPVANSDGSTNVPGLYIVGDLTGIPLLKFAADSGARAVQKIATQLSSETKAADSGENNEVLDLVIIGGGVSGFAAALEARKLALSFAIYESSEAFSTIVNFPRGKPIYTYPTEMTPAGVMQFDAEKSTIKEGLLEDLRSQVTQAGIEPRNGFIQRVERKNSEQLFEVQTSEGVAARGRFVIAALGRSGNHRKLNIPGEDLDFIYNRLHDPRDFCGKRIVIVGGGDSALEIAIALASCGSQVTLSYRKKEFSRAKAENIEAVQSLVQQGDADVHVEHPTSEFEAPAVGTFIPERAADEKCLGCGGSLRGYPPEGDCPGCGKPYSRKLGHLRLLMGSNPKEFKPGTAVIKTAEGEEEAIEADAVFVMTGREPPLDFFRRSGVAIRGEWRLAHWVSMFAFILFCAFLYHWKSDAGFGLKTWWKDQHLFPFNLADPLNPAHFLGTLALSMQKPSFYYTLAYTLCIGIFGYKRIKRRRTPYVKVQTITLFWIQTIPLFLLPYLLLPWLGHNGWFDSGFGQTVADALFPLTEWDNHGREYWRSVGFILAWPLLPWNFFTGEPYLAWLIIGSLQTFVLIPWLVFRYGKGAYCGWICSCGALAETMGDTHREKMPHGPLWNRLNFIGQFFLALALLLFAVRILGWVAPHDSWLQKTANTIFMAGLYGRDVNWGNLPFPMKFISYEWFVDLLWAGIFGVCFYFYFSGRIWCRFACPLAALMHIYARFSRFRIFADKKKCISCNVCTSVCHQGIDIMNFANKGVPMEDPQCVRCSACVQSCPTGVLTFGRFDHQGNVIHDRLLASPVQMAELTVNGRPPAA